MDVNVLLRGQSNAEYIFTDGDMPALQAKVEQYLGWTGTGNTVNLIGGVDVSAFGQTTLLPSNNSPNPSWLEPSSTAASGYVAGTYEQSLLDMLNALPAEQKADPTVTIWFHNETDSWNGLETAAQWGQAVQADMQMVRQALGQTAATTPYVFANEPYDWGPGGVAYYNALGLAQGIRAEQALLSANPALNTSLTASIGDQDMDRTDAFFGGQHGSVQDDAMVIDRMARAVALSLEAYAAPGAPVLSNFDVTGPQITRATALLGHADQLVASIQLAPGTDGLQALSAEAAQGAGFSVLLTDGTQIDATSVAVIDGHDLRITFGQDIPLDGTLYYGYGVGRIALTGQAGEGSAVYDTQALPLSDTPFGIGLGGITATPVALDAAVTSLTATTPVVSLTQNSLVYGTQAPVQINVGSTQSQVFLASGDANVQGGSGRVVAYGGAGTDVLVGGSAGGNVLVAGSGATTIVGAADDLLSAGTGTAQVYVGSGETTVFGAASGGHATVTASTGSDLVIAGPGTTSIYGGTGPIQVWGTPTPDASMAFVGGTGDALVMAGQGFDTLTGGSGTSTLVGGSGSAVITAGSGPTTVFTGSGADTVSVGAQTTVVEGTGSAWILGSNAPGVVFAGSGNTTLMGGTGGGTVYVGSGTLVAQDAGPTTYAFLDTVSGGSLTVSHFTVGQDHIQGVITAASTTAQGTVLTLDTGAHATLLGVFSTQTGLFS